MSVQTSSDIIAQQAMTDPYRTIRYANLGYAVLEEQAMSRDVKDKTYDINPITGIPSATFTSGGQYVEFELDKSGHQIQDTELKMVVFNNQAATAMTVTMAPLLIDRVEYYFNDQIFTTDYGMNAVLDMWSLNYDEDQVAIGPQAGYNPTTFVTDAASVLAAQTGRTYYFKLNGVLAQTEFPYGVRGDKIRVRIYFQSGAQCYETGSASTTLLQLTSISLRITARVYQDERSIAMLRAAASGASADLILRFYQHNREQIVVANATSGVLTNGTIQLPGRNSNVWILITPSSPANATQRYQGLQLTSFDMLAPDNSSLLGNLQLEDSYVRNNYIPKYYNGKFASTATGYYYMASWSDDPQTAYVEGIYLGGHYMQSNSKFSYVPASTSSQMVNLFYNTLCGARLSPYGVKLFTDFNGRP